MKKDIVVGAGLVGCLQGVILRQMGKSTTIYEKRKDWRKSGTSSGRSINLVVTSRGIRTLVEVGLWEKVAKISVPVRVE